MTPKGQQFSKLDKEENHAGFLEWLFFGSRKKGG